MMKNKAEAMVLASFAADSLALGVHWIYDIDRIVKDFGRVESFRKPKPDSYHPAKNKGEFTHYGDQTFVLLESLAAQGKFDLDNFSRRWRELFQDYIGYCDMATKNTIKSFSVGTGPEDSGSSSNDIAGASRIVPLIFSLRSDLDALVKAAQAQTRMTHNDALTIAASDFFARVSWEILHGSSPVESISRIAERNFANTSIAQWVDTGIASKDMDSVSAIGRFGRTCHTPDCFPGVIHLIAKYEDNLKEALIQAVMAGGDSAARGMLVGMIIGAHLGMNSIPKKWLSELRLVKEIRSLLKKIG